MALTKKEANEVMRKKYGAYWYAVERGALSTRPDVKAERDALMGRKKPVLGEWGGLHIVGEDY